MDHDVLGAMPGLATFDKGDGTYLARYPDLYEVTIKPNPHGSGWVVVGPSGNACDGSRQSTAEQAAAWAVAHQLAV